MTTRQVASMREGRHADAPTKGSVEAWPASERVPAFVWFFLAGLVANLFAGNATILLGLPLAPDRPLFLLAVVLLVLDPRRRSLRPRVNHMVIAALFVWIFFSWFLTGSLLDTYKAFAFSDRIVLPLVMFVVGPLVFDSASSRLLLLKMLTVIGIYLGVTGIAEMSHLDALVFPRGIADSTLGIQYGRARGPFLGSEPMGMSSLLIAVSAGFLATRATRWWRAVAVLASVLCAVTAILSLTRSVWLSMILVAILGVSVVRPLRRRLPLIVAGFAAAGLATVALLPGLTTLITERAETSRSVYDRVLTNDAALRILEYHPLFGVGWGRFVDVADVYVRQASNYPLTNTNIIVHNVFLSLAADSGIAAAVLWGLAMLTGPVAAVASFRTTRSTEMRGWQFVAACALLVWIVPTLVSPNPYPFPNNLVWLIGGVAGRGLLLKPRAAEIALSRRSSRGECGDQKV